MFLFKKIVSHLFLPVSLCTEILVVGTILLWFTRKQKAGKTIVSIGVVMLLLLSNSMISHRLLKPLEDQYPPFVSRPENTGTTTLVKFIVVLGGGHSSNPRLPITSQLGEESMVRLSEGIRLYNEWPGRKLILSGGTWLDPVPEAEVMTKAAQALGVRQQDIVLESQSRDTEDEARLVEPIVGTAPFILVTSSLHMPRSMGLFKKLGMNPMAAPTDFLAREGVKIGPDDVYPNPRALLGSEKAVYEYLGLAWEKLRGKI